MALLDIALVSLAAVKEYLSISTTDTTHDSILEMIINSVSAQFNQFADRRFAEKDYVDLKLDGPGVRILSLPAWPITRVTSLHEDNVLLTEDKDFIIYAESGYLKRVACDWSKGEKNIKISFSAGYECITEPLTLPHDLRFAALKQIAFEFSKFQKKNWGEESRSFPDGSVSFTTSELLDDVKEILKRYRRIKCT